MSDVSPRMRVKEGGEKEGRVWQMYNNECHPPFKGQLQHFDKLSLFDRFRHVENGFDIIF